MDNYDVAPLELERDLFIKTVVKALGICKDQREIVDFNDMIWFCVVNRFARSRLISGVGANAYAQGVTLVVQLVSTPALLAAFGAKTYGLWLVVSALPTYIALADLGRPVRRGERHHARGDARSARGGARDIQSTLALNLLTAAVILALTGAAIALAPIRSSP